METTVYYYSKSRLYFMVIAFTGIELYLLYVVIDFILDSNLIAILVFSILSILNAAGLVYLTRKFLIPAARNEAAIELDDKKLQYNIGNWELYWIDIKKIDHYMDGMTVTLKNGDEISLSLKWVSGQYDEIDDKMNEYLKNAN